MFKSILCAAVLLAATGDAVAQPPTGTATTRAYITNVYKSYRLKADIKLERMQIAGFSPFWGGRISGMKPNSPLRALGLQLGDVITRMDGSRISNSRYWVSAPPIPGVPGASGYWALPETERHYGQTELRYIKTGQQNVRLGWVELGPRFWPPTPPGPGPAPGPGPIAP